MEGEGGETDVRTVSVCGTIDHVVAVSTAEQSVFNSVIIRAGKLR